MHLPNCGHFGESGEYMSEHSEWCLSAKGYACTCNPDARRKARQAELSAIERLIIRKTYLAKALTYKESVKLAKFILDYAENRKKKKV